MTHWSAMLGALALMTLPLLHWFVLRRGLAVSGRFSTLVDRLRHGRPVDTNLEGATQEQLLAAVRAMTAAELGADAVEDAPAPQPDRPLALVRPPERAHVHAMFLSGLLLGGVVSALLGGGLFPTTGLHGALFPQIFGDAPLARGLVLFGGGLLVGAGTRMAGGCTSGHGLCGVSQLQAGSLLATASFFGAGVLVSLALATSL